MVIYWRAWNGHTATRATEWRLRQVIFLRRASPAQPDNLPAAAIAPAKTHQARRKAEPKLLDANTCPLCRDKMTELMHQHQQSKHRDSGEQVPVVHNHLFIDNALATQCIIYYQDTPYENMLSILPVDTTDCKK